MLQDLKRRERDLQHFFETAMEGVQQVSMDGIVLWANDAQHKLLGCSTAEYDGHAVEEFFEDRTVARVMLEGLWRGVPVHDQLALLRRSDGATLHVLIRADCCTEDHTLRYSRWFIRDVSDRVRAEEHQQRLLATERAARENAERTSNMRDEFLAVLSHELRTPLVAILGWTELLREQGLDAATVVEGVTVIDRQAHMQLRLVSELLDMSRAITGKLDLVTRPVAIDMVLQTAVDSVRFVADAQHVTIELHLDTLGTAPGTLQVSGDSDRLQQVFGNLLTNAVKFTSAGGRIDLHVRHTPTLVEVVMVDTGKGIRADFLPHVFERFQQGDSSDTRQHGGLGIGLSLVKQLVELHDGTVTVASAGEGLGSQFTVILPLLVGARLSPVSPAVSPVPPGSMCSSQFATPEAPPLSLDCDMAVTPLAVALDSVTAVAAAAAPEPSGLPPKTPVSRQRSPSDGTRSPAIQCLSNARILVVDDGLLLHSSKFCVVRLTLRSDGQPACAVHVLDTRWRCGAPGC
jgi:PAS domain S-box-containing protein